MKKGQTIWVSAALYFGLGIIVLTIILAAGMPAIKKLQDKNIILQTKEIMFTIDNNIREVARGGTGTQRLVRTEIKKGDFKIINEDDLIVWKYKTKSLLSEPNISLQEGTLNLITKESNVVGEYDITLWLNYTNILNLTFTNPSGTLQVGSDLIIKNNGTSNLIDVVISEKL